MKPVKPMIVPSHNKTRIELVKVFKPTKPKKPSAPKQTMSVEECVRILDDYEHKDAQEWIDSIQSKIDQMNGNPNKRDMVCVEIRYDTDAYNKYGYDYGSETNNVRVELVQTVIQDNPHYAKQQAKYLKAKAKYNEAMKAYKSEMKSYKAVKEKMEKLLGKEAV